MHHDVARIDTLHSRVTTVLIASVTGEDHWFHRSGCEIGRTLANVGPGPPVAPLLLQPFLVVALLSRILPTMQNLP